MPQGGCDHIGILTGNAEALVVFYRDLLGFEVAKKDIVASAIMESIFGVPGDCRLIKLAQAGAEEGAVVIEIFSYVDADAVPSRPRTAGYNHWGFRVGDRESFVAEMRSRGVDVTEIQRGSHRVYFICDPDGNRIEIRD